MTKLSTVLACFASLVLGACSDDTGGDEGSSGSSGSSGDSASCTIPGKSLLADDPKQLSDIAVSGDHLVFVSDDRSIAIPATIERIGLDGSNRTTLFTPSERHLVIDTRTHGDTVYFLDEDTTDPVPAPELWSIPVAGGTATRLGGSTFREGTIFGVDDTSVYIAQLTDSPVGSVYDRVDRATGATVRIATSPAGTGTPTQITLTAKDVFYLAGTVGDGAGSLDLYRFGNATAGQTASKVLPGGLSALCDIGLAGFYATPTKLGCGYSALRVANHDGSGITELLSKDPAKVATSILMGAGGENLYVHDANGEKTRTGAFRRIASSGGGLVPIACDLGQLQNRLNRASFPIATEYEFVVGASEIYWVEMTGAANDPKWTIRHATK